MTTETMEPKSAPGEDAFADDDYRVVWKFGPLRLGPNDLEMQEGARLLKFDWQKSADGEYNRTFVWALVDPTAPLVTRRLAILATGTPMTQPGIYVGTILDDDRRHVWHLFDKGMV